MVNKDQAKGVGKQAKGSVKEAAGKAIGNEQMEAEGKVGKAAGKVQKGYGDAVPALLAFPDRAVAGFTQRLRGKIPVGRFQLLQADDIGCRGGQPRQQMIETAIDIVDVESGDPHAARAQPRSSQRSRISSVVEVSMCWP